MLWENFETKEFFSYLAELLSLHVSHVVKMEERNTPFSQSEYPKTSLGFEGDRKKDVKHFWYYISEKNSHSLS